MRGPPLKPAPATLRALVRKLGNFAPLTTQDEQVIESIGSSDESFAPGAVIIGEGDAPRSVFVLTEGIACRYRDMPDGRRQIMTFLLPGDMCDLHVFLVGAMDHSISALSPVRLSAIARPRILDLLFNRPRIAAALWWSSLQEEAILRERIVALGRRNAHGRIAYLLCELLWRYQAVGLDLDRVVSLPLSQVDLADTLGLTPVHVNRVLKQLREDGLVALSNRMMTILDLGRLQAIAGFDSSYLHLGGAPEEVAEHFDRLENRVRH
jgi:CRP-like cAMP-binding protein